MVQTNNEIQNLRTMKNNDPEINLYIMFDQTRDLMSNAVELELKHLRITLAQVKVLTTLSREDEPITMDKLAKLTLKEFNSVSTLINRMEEKGLVKKIKKEGDLKTYVALTEKGSDLYYRQVTERSIHMILNKLSAEEKNQLYSILKKLRDTMRDILGLDFKPPFLP